METVEDNDHILGALRAQIRGTEHDLQRLKSQLRAAEERHKQATQTREPKTPAIASALHGTTWPLTPEEYTRYGRQMIVPQIGLQGQLRLKAASVLIVGVGGLGCPAAAYLAGSGIGTIGLVDGDTVELSNLHRQILHTSDTVGLSKVNSAVQYLNKLNPLVQYNCHCENLQSQNAFGLFSEYDLVLDCTDRPSSRYLISDAAVLSGKPLISASALRTEGQLMTLNHPAQVPGDPGGGPCYRCIFPKPPPADTVLSCGDSGIVGPVVGVMGVLQALEAIKLISSGTVPLAGSMDPRTTSNTEATSPPSLVMFSAYSLPPFRQVRLRGRRSNCAVCSASASVTLQTLTTGSLDYLQFCGSIDLVTMLDAQDRISPSDYSRVRLESKAEHVLIDVREKVHFDICHLPGSLSIPFSIIDNRASQVSNEVTEDQTSESLQWLPAGIPPEVALYVICRLGNDSQVAVKKLKEANLDMGGKRFVGDIRDGFRGWRKEVDSDWPDY